MARKQKMTVNYFPHYVNDGKTIFILESKFGNDGYSFWFKLLEILGKSPKHFYDCRDTYNFNFLLAKTRFTEEKTTEILDLLAGLNAIDEELWKMKIIYSENFIDNLDSVYNRRDTQPATKKEIIDNIKDLSKVLMSTKMPQTEDSVDKKQGSKEKRSKEKRSKEKIVSTHPLLLFIFKELPNVSKLKDQLTEEQADKLIVEFDKNIIEEVLGAMENKADLVKKYISVNRTLRNWIKIRLGGKYNGTIRDSISKSPIKSRTDYRYDSEKAGKRLEELEKQFGE